MAQESRNSEQDTAGCQHSEGPVYCVNNCGLLGNPATMNLCSQCYLAMAVKEPDSFPSKVLAFPEDSLVLPTEIGKSMPNLDTDTIVSAVPKVGQTVKHDKRQQVELNDGSPQQAGPSIIQQHQHGSRLVNRCFTCNKRVGLTVFKCRCGDMFCSLHRYSDRHSCAYDYKAAARDSIAKANPLVHASKIEKI